MSTSGPHGRVRNLMDTADTCGFLGGRGRMTRSLKAGVVSLAAGGALTLAAVCGGGTAAVSLSKAAPASYGTMTRVSRGLEQGDMLTESGNWAGYVIQPGQDVGDVSGEWTVPALDCQQTPNALDAMWAGIGGVPSDAELLQTGVSDSCKGGVQQHWAWWELWPASPVNLGLRVFPGDEMAASVYRDQAGQWVTRIDNLTTGWSGWMFAGGTYGVGRDGSGTFTREGSASYISYAGGRTAEWVVEKPSVAGPEVVSFPDFGTVQFSDLRTGLQSWSLSPDEGEEIIYDHRALAVPGLPDRDGFTVSYTG
jgi:hypothetical protein